MFLMLVSWPRLSLNKLNIVTPNDDNDDNDEYIKWIMLTLMTILSTADDDDVK